MNAKQTLPSRRLNDPNKETQHIYTHSTKTDIRALFRALQVEARQSANVAQIRRKK
jgi:hypothetical protein